MFLEKINQLRQSKFVAGMRIPVFILIALVEYVTVEWSFLGIAEIMGVPFVYKLAGFATVLFANVVLVVLCKRVRVAQHVSVVLFGALAITNYYVNAFRGTPFSFYLLQNIVAAANVAGAYTFALTPRVLLILASMAVQLILVNLCFYKAQWKRKFSAIGLALLCVGMYFTYLSPTPVVPEGIVGWSWIGSARTYGYMSCLMRSGATKLNMPEEYDEAALEESLQNYSIQNTGSATPDVIFILNETFFDLTQVTDVQASQDPLENIHRMENLRQGYCAVPGEGGGTNVSEYEFLFSNSVYLAPNTNPVIAMDIDGSNSMVSHLESLGYSTLGAHSEPGVNYARTMVYPTIGFDQIYFEEDFVGQTYYGDREFESDESLYENLIRWYEEMGEGPRALYLLTMQNHGPYGDLDAGEYLVKTGRDYGALTAEVNEYLTCISLSDQAFQKLTEYFSSVERDVVICMVGDHAPYWVSDVTDVDCTAEQRALLTRGTPYVIWSNHIDLSQAELPQWISLPYVVPLTLEAAGIQLSAYYDYMAELSRSVPVLTAYGSYVTADGTIYTYDQQTEHTQAIQRYFWLDYANMTKADFMMKEKD